MPSELKINASEGAALARLLRLHKSPIVRLLTPGNALEIGCGIGSWLALLKGLGWETTGIEPDPNYAALGRELYGLDIHADLFERVPLPTQGFELIAAFHVLEHVSDPRRFLLTAAERLTENGVLVIEVPTLDRPAAGDLGQFFWTRHLNVFSRSFLETANRELGFSIEGSGYWKNNYLGIFKKRQSETRLSVARAAAAPLLRMRALGTGYALASATSATRRLWQLAWRMGTRTITRDNIHMLRALTRRFASIQWRNVESSMPFHRRAARFVHFGAHKSGNAGDAVLAAAVRAAIDIDVPHRWLLKDVRKVVAAEDVASVNRSVSAVVVGGGGLFLADTNYNAISGWQWPINTELMSRIEVPIVIFAVGYNRFRGQDRLSEVFEQNLRALVERSLFVGIRNTGSIRELRKYLPEALHEKLSFQPCPTTVLSYLRMSRRLESRRLRRKSNRPVLAVNVAFDRFGRRFGDRVEEILPEIARTVAQAQQDGWEVAVARHIQSDNAIVPYLERAGVKYRMHDLCFASIDDTMSFYSSVTAAMGMRGHSQMIPFGLGIPILSLIAHDKMAWFLEDIGHPEWGVDVAADDFHERLALCWSQLASQIEHRGNEVQRARARLWQITRSNVSRFTKLLSTK